MSGSILPFTLKAITDEELSTPPLLYSPPSPKRQKSPQSGSQVGEDEFVFLVGRDRIWSDGDIEFENYESMLPHTLRRTRSLSSLADYEKRWDEMEFSLGDLKEQSNLAIRKIIHEVSLLFSVRKSITPESERLFGQILEAGEEILNSPSFVNLQWYTGIIERLEALGRQWEGLQYPNYPMRILFQFGKPARWASSMVSCHSKEQASLICSNAISRPQIQTSTITPTISESDSPLRLYLSIPSTPTPGPPSPNPRLHTPLRKIVHRNRSRVSSPRVTISSPFEGSPDPNLGIVDSFRTFITELFDDNQPPSADSRPGSSNDNAHIDVNHLMLPPRSRTSRKGSGSSDLSVVSRRSSSDTRPPGSAESPHLSASNTFSNTSNAPSTATAIAPGAGAMGGNRSGSPSTCGAPSTAAAVGGGGASALSSLVVKPKLGVQVPTEFDEGDNDLGEVNTSLALLLQRIEELWHARSTLSALGRKEEPFRKNMMATVVAERNRASFSGALIPSPATIKEGMLMAKFPDSPHWSLSFFVLEGPTTVRTCSALLCFAHDYAESQDNNPESQSGIYILEPDTTSVNTPCETDDDVNPPSYPWRFDLIYAAEQPAINFAAKEELDQVEWMEALQYAGQQSTASWTSHDDMTLTRVRQLALLAIECNDSQLHDLELALQELVPLLDELGKLHSLLASYVSECHKLISSKTRQLALQSGHGIHHAVTEKLENYISTMPPNSDSPDKTLSALSLEISTSRVRDKRLSLEMEPTASATDFEVISPISKGAFGVVYLARHKETKELYAIKALAKKEVIRKKQTKLVTTERDILASIKCPYVVNLHYCFQTKTHFFLVMEFVCGGDCYSLLDELGCLPVELVVIYIAELVQALEYLHHQGIVHRDVKPENILISATGHLKLTDFGLSDYGLAKQTDMSFNKQNFPKKERRGAAYNQQQRRQPSVERSSSRNSQPQTSQSSSYRRASMPIATPSRPRDRSGSGNDGPRLLSRSLGSNEHTVVVGSPYADSLCHSPSPTDHLFTNDHRPPSNNPLLSPVTPPSSSDEDLSSPLKKFVSVPPEPKPAFNPMPFVRLLHPDIRYQSSEDGEFNWPESSSPVTPCHTPPKRSLVGTPTYLAPEIVLGQGHGPPADWWAIGVVLYEFLSGIPPFYDEDPEVMFEKIVTAVVPESDAIPPDAMDLIRGFLVADPKQRLGSHGTEAIKRHPFFKTISWDTLNDSLKVPNPIFAPQLDPNDYTSYFEPHKHRHPSLFAAPHTAILEPQSSDLPSQSPSQQDHLDGFDFVGRPAVV